MRKLKPTTPSNRHTVLPSYGRILTAKKPKKKLTKGFKRSVGRNNAGRITTRHKGGGHKRLYREIDFKYWDKKDIPAKVETIEYDPNRSGFIGLICYKDGERRYVLLSSGVSVGEEIITSEKAKIKAGNRLPLFKIPVGTFVYNIELKYQGGSKIARSAGNHAEVFARDAGYVNLKMPSGEIRRVPEKAFASIGEVSNSEHKLRVIGKAGRSRWMGIRPTVRGSVMNPVDHPYGGGEGKSGRGMKRAKTKWGKPAGKRQKTRKPKKYSNKLIIQRRKVGKKR